MARLWLNLSAKSIFAFVRELPLHALAMGIVYVL